MLGLLRVVRGSMAFQPERSRRFFTLRVVLKEELPLEGRDEFSKRRLSRSIGRLWRVLKKKDRFCLLGRV
jgi:hypothetical protein